MNKIEIFRLDSNAILPTRNNKEDAGLDFYALEDVFLIEGTTCLVKTGVAARVPTGYVGLLRERSSIGKKGMKVAGGVIDAGYSGDISILLMNVSNRETFVQTSTKGGSRGYQIKAGDRIAQLVLCPIITPEIIEVKEIWISDRGDKKFGSSGT